MYKIPVTLTFSQPIELPDGSIMLNMRNEYKFHCSCRGVAISYDGADTFPMEHLYFDETLIDPAVAAGLLFHNNMVFFTNPKSTTKREYCYYTLFISSLYSNVSAYS